MNDNAKKWLAALRSDKYKQCRESLHIEKDGEHSFCCLGVGCELAIQDGVVVKKIREVPNLGTPYYKYGKEGFSGVPPQIIQEYLGLNSGYIYRIIDQNDLYKKTFSQIADFLEENEGVLFESER